MARSIKDSLDLLDTSRGDIRSALSEKSVEAPETLKVSEVDDYIKQIEAGGGTAPLNYIESVEYNTYKGETDYTTVTTNPACVALSDSGYQIYSPNNFKIKVKKNCHMFFESDKILNYTSLDLKAGETITFDYEFLNQDKKYLVILFGEQIEFSPPNPPDILIIAVYQELG